MPVAPVSDVERRELRERVQALVAIGDLASLQALLPRLHPSDVGDVLASLDDEQRVALIKTLPVELASEALAEMEEDEERGDILAALAPEESAELLQELEDDDAADLIAELDPDERKLILDRLPADDAGEIRGLLLFDEETAGRLMTTSLVAVSADISAEEAIAEVRRQGREVEDFYNIFVVDQRRMLQGTVPLDDLILSNPTTLVANLVRPTDATVLPDVDQEEVGRLMSRYNMVDIPVVDATGVLMGRITFDDVIDVMEAEQTEDLFAHGRRFGRGRDTRKVARGREGASPLAGGQSPHRVHGRVGRARVRADHRIVLVHGCDHADHRGHGRKLGHPIASGDGAPHRGHAGLPGAPFRRRRQGGSGGSHERTRPRAAGLRHGVDRGSRDSGRKSPPPLGRSAGAVGQHHGWVLHGCDHSDHTPPLWD